MIINIIKAVSYIICISFLIWFVGSWIEICAHNLSTAEYSEWNLIMMIAGGRL